MAPVRLRGSSQGPAIQPAVPVSCDPVFQLSSLLGQRFGGVRASHQRTGRQRAHGRGIHTLHAGALALAADGVRDNSVQHHRNINPRGRDGRGPAQAADSRQYALRGDRVV